MWGSVRVRCLTQDDTTIALPSRPQHPQFFAAFKVTFLILQVCFKPTVAHNCHSNNKYLTAKPKMSRRNQIPHGKSKMLTAITNYSRQNQNAHGKTKKLTANQKPRGKSKKLTAKAKAHGKSKSSRQKQKLTTKAKALAAKANSSRQNQNQRKGSWALIVHAKAVGDKSNMAASSSLSSQMFCSNCGAEAVPTANICTRCGQGNMLQVYFVYTRMGELMNTR